MNILDKKKWYAKIAVKSFLLHPQGKSKSIKNGANSCQMNEDRNFKTYDDLTMFQVDGMYDGISSSEDEKMVIDEGSQNEMETNTSRNFEMNTSSHSHDDIPPDEKTRSEDFMSVQLPPLSDKLKNELNVDENFRTLSFSGSIINTKCKENAIGSPASGTSNTDRMWPNVIKPNSSDSAVDSTKETPLSCDKEGSDNGSEIKGKKNKIDEILSRARNKKYNSRGRRGAGVRGRGKHGIMHSETSETSNVLSNIMAAQEKTSQMVKNETIFKTPVSIKKQIYEFNGLNNAFAENGDAHKDYTHPIEDTNVNYSLWKLEKKSETDLIHKVEKAMSDNSLQILVRSGIHGVRLEKCPNSPYETIPQLYTVDCKLENQVEYGGEKLSKAELAKQWIATLLRPNSKLARLRVNVANQEALMAENKTLKDLTNDGLKIGFKPEEALGNLFTLFSELKTLPIPTEKEGVARYLLKHDSKTGAFVKVLKSVEQCETSQAPTSGTVDVHLAYNTYSHDAPLPPVNKRWLPLDPDLITPYHEINEKVPCLFAPKPFTKNNSPRGRGRNRGRRCKTSN